MYIYIYVKGIAMAVEGEGRGGDRGWLSSRQIEGRR